MSTQMFVIETPKGTVSGFNAGYGCVQHTNDTAYARKFASPAAAERFLNRYADCGYGLVKDGAKVVPLTEKR